MDVKKFNQLRKDVKAGKIEGLKRVISDLTLQQAQTIENIMFDLELTDEMNKVLDELVIYIDSLVQAEKVANKKAPEKAAPEKAASKNNKAKKLADTLKIGDIVYFRVEGEEIMHPVKIIYKSKYDIIAITKDEREVFKIRKIDFNKQIFEWTDRKGETYNIIVTL